MGRVLFDTRHMSIAGKEIADQTAKLAALKLVLDIRIVFNMDI